MKIPPPHAKLRMIKRRAAGMPVIVAALALPVAFTGCETSGNGPPGAETQEYYDPNTFGFSADGSPKNHPGETRSGATANP